MPLVHVIHKFVHFMFLFFDAVRSTRSDIAGVVRWLEDLSRKGADLAIQCRACGHDRTVAIGHALDIFCRRRWSTDWWDAHRRFRCRKCGSKDVKLDADLYGHALRRQRTPAKLAVVEERLRPGLRPPPPGVALSEWNRATEVERKRLVDRARS